jgi:hypothetical protein
VEEWDIVYYKTAAGGVPAFEYLLESCTTKLEAYLHSILDSVAAAPPPAFSGGGRWEAMHGNMSGYHAAKAIGPDRKHHRIFCVLENSDNPDEMERRGLPCPAIAVITGMWKPNATLFSELEYAAVRELGDEYKKQHPRRIADAGDVEKYIAEINAKKIRESDTKLKKQARRRKK